LLYLLSVISGLHFRMIFFYCDDLKSLKKGQYNRVIKRHNS
jgi:hypothetical protein